MSVSKFRKSKAPAKWGAGGRKVVILTFKVSSCRLASDERQNNHLSFQILGPSDSIILTKHDYIKDTINRYTISTERKWHFFSQGENKLTQTAPSITVEDLRSLIRTLEE